MRRADRIVLARWRRGLRPWSTALLRFQSRREVARRYDSSRYDAAKARQERDAADPIPQQEEARFTIAGPMDHWYDPRAQPERVSAGIVERDVTPSSSHE